MFKSLIDKTCSDKKLRLRMSAMSCSSSDVVTFTQVKRLFVVLCNVLIKMCVCACLSGNVPGTATQKWAVVGGTHL